MKIFAINEAYKPPRISSLAIVSGTLLCTLAAAGPSLGADLPYSYTPYPQSYYGNDYYNNGYYDSGYPVYDGCYRCDYCYYRCDYCCTSQPIAERAPVPWVEPRPIAAVSERYWTERDYMERSYYPYYAATRYGYPPPWYSQYTPYTPYAQYAPYPPRPYHYSHYYPGAYYPTAYYPGPGREPDRYAGYRAPYGDPRHTPGQGGLQYPPYAAAYEYQAGPHNPYRYVDTTRSPYDYGGYRPEYEYRPPHGHETGQRPPTRGPNGYSGSGYPQ